jgi:nucleoside-diphosphate-sugar epimerase
MSATRHVLLTGATGFVGSHVAELLSLEGLRVRCTARPTSDLRWLSGLPVEIRETDLSSRASVDSALEGVTDVVHAAGLTRARRDAEYFRVNAEATQLVAEAAVAAGVGRFVLVSSLAARGPDGAPGPVSAYGASKREAEERLASVAERSAGSLATRVLRPGGVYGPRDRDLLPLFRVAALGFLPAPPGTGRLQPVHARDAAAAVQRALLGDGEDPGPIAIGGPTVHDWAEMAAALGAAIGRPVRLVRVPRQLFLAAGALAELAAEALRRAPDLDRRRARDLTRLSWTCDLGPAERGLGWTPSVTLRDGLAETATWYREAGWLRR